MSELDHELNNDNRYILVVNKTTTTKKTTTTTNSKESNMNNKNTNRPVGLPIVQGYLKLGMPAHLREALRADGSEPLATRRLVRKQTLSFEP